MRAYNAVRTASASSSVSFSELAMTGISPAEQPPPNSPRPTSAANAEHYTWGAACDGWHLVRDTSLSVILERLPPGASEMRHRHARARQFFYVLRGALLIEIEGDAHTLRAGDGIDIAPTLAHQVTCVGPEDAEFLVVSQPPSHGDRELAPA